MPIVLLLIECCRSSVLLGKSEEWHVLDLLGAPFSEALMEEPPTITKRGREAISLVISRQLLAFPQSEPRTSSVRERTGIRVEE